jgi:hypothetical protein
MTPAPTVTTTDVAGTLAAILDTIEDLRVYAYVADTFRPPGALIMQPEIDYADPTATFCRATWQFPVGVVVSRNQDRKAQADLAEMVNQVAAALFDAEVEDVFSIEPLNAIPQTVTVAGQDLPGYLITVRVRA